MFNKQLNLFLGIALLLLACTSHLSYAQKTDSTFNAIPKPVSKHSPKLATLLSTALPGLGQIYNRSYWKLPVLYGGFVGLGYWVAQNQELYSRYFNAYKARIDNDPNTVDDYVGKYTNDNLNVLQEYYHSYRDLALICVAGLYVINIVDACVDAHMFTYDVSENLSLQIQPTLIQQPGMAFSTAGLSFNFKIH